jgi:hypothetical protein
MVEGCHSSSAHGTGKERKERQQRCDSRQERAEAGKLDRRSLLLQSPSSSRQRSKEAQWELVGVGESRSIQVDRSCMCIIDSLWGWVVHPSCSRCITEIIIDPYKSTLLVLLHIKLAIAIWLTPRLDVIGNWPFFVPTKLVPAATMMHPCLDSSVDIRFRICIYSTAGIVLTGLTSF